MNTADILNIDNLRDFIYNNSNKKVLIGSRGVGKTSALLINMFRNSIKEEGARDAIYISGYSTSIKAAKELFIKICNDFNITDIEVYNMNPNCYRITVMGRSTLYFATEKALDTVLRHIRLKDAYIDEPNSLDIDNLLDNINYRTI